jgi:hypothetical protein
MYYLFGSYRIGGSHSGGGETPVSVRLGIEHFSRTTVSVYLSSALMTRPSRPLGNTHERIRDIDSPQSHSPTVNPSSGDLTFLVWSQKTPNSGTRFLTGFNPPFHGQNSHFTGRKMYANRRYWMAKPGRGRGGSRVRGKRTPVLGSVLFPKTWGDLQSSQTYSPSEIFQH